MGNEKEPRFYGIVTEKSHNNMSKIKGKDTSIEVKLRRALWAKGIRFRKNYKLLPGTPDIVLTKYKIAIFCDSEFFHGKDWEVLLSKLEKGNNSDYWINKIKRNIERDKSKDKLLHELGWIVIHFWGNDINKNVNECVTKVEKIILEERIKGDE